MDCDILGTWREKEREKLDAWRLKEDDEEGENMRPTSRDRGNRDIRQDEPLPPPRDRGNRDIRQDEPPPPPRDRGNRDIRRDEPPRDFRRGEREERSAFSREREDRGFGRDFGGRDREDRGFGRDRDDRGGSSNERGSFGSRDDR